MIRKYFGTDGIRGTVNDEKMTAEVALRLGMAAGHLFRNGNHRHRVVIGKDTRLSGYMIEPALVAGFTSMGMDVFLFGPIPTPAVSFLTRSLRADLGVMISASHNHFEDNGIKLFGPDGFKLSDQLESDIEALMSPSSGLSLAAPAALGRAKRIDDSQARYIEFAKRTFPRDLTLDGVKIVLDCANGASYRVAPTALWELGAEVIAIGVEPDGFNINKECGSTSTAQIRARVIKEGADIGIALDGDADRVIIIDEKGQEVDGDQIMGLIALDWLAHDRLRQPGIVTTVMSNLGLERCLNEVGLAMIRANVGDRYVVEQMRAGNYNLGGEQSGHIVLSDFSSTGDGLIAALQVLAVMKRRARKVSEICSVFKPVPQILRNVSYGGGEPLGDSKVVEAIRAAEDVLGRDGRILVRKSGTENLIRVMGEGDDAQAVDRAVSQIVEAVNQVASAA
jgi:phosphoglucosamine mutase